MIVSDYHVSNFKCQCKSDYLHHQICKVIIGFTHVETLQSVLWWSSSKSRKGELPAHTMMMTMMTSWVRYLPDRRMKQRTPRDHWSVSVVIASKLTTCTYRSYIFQQYWNIMVQLVSNYWGRKGDFTLERQTSLYIRSLDIRIHLSAATLDKLNFRCLNKL